MGVPIVSLPRFFCALPLAERRQLVLPDATHRHVRVLRLHAGDELELFHGDGRAFEAYIVAHSAKMTEVFLGSVKRLDPEPPLFITLAQGVATGERMDFVLQKGVELGISAFQPLWTTRSTVQMEADRWKKKQLHWQRVAIAACEQCGSNTLPTVSEACAIQEWLPRNPGGMLLTPVGGASLRQVSRPIDRHLCLLVGPEGGFTPFEYQMALAHHFIPLTLGPRVLRTETAALVAAAIIQSQWGDL